MPYRPFSLLLLIAIVFSFQNADATLIQGKHFTGNSEFIDFGNSEKPDFDRLSSVMSSYGLHQPETLKLISTEPDNLGMIHYRFVETSYNEPVEGTMWIVHTRNGKIESMNGVLFAMLPAPNAVSLNLQAAHTAALQYVSAKSYYKTTVDSELYWACNGNIDALRFRLCYRFDIYAQEPLSRKYIFIDVSSGEVITEESRIDNTDAIGTAITAYSGTQTITSDSYNNYYRLREAGRGNGIETYDLNQGTNYYAATDFVDSNNYWNNVDPALDQYATDAHWGAEKTYDYYYNVYGRNSVDNAGLKLVSYIHYSVGYVNAFWDGSEMIYGDGDNAYTPLTALDITGHEITHGLTQYTAKLNYLNESGAIDESFSDCMGTSIEFYTKPNAANWTIGEDVGIPFRNLANPKQYLQPNTYKGQYWYTGTADFGGVHTNSGVMNYWFYLVSVGGSGANDLNNNYNVKGITIQEASAIAYRMQTLYLFPNAQYTDARTYSIKAATDLYGACSQEVITVTNAWYAVGVGAASSVAAVSITANPGNTICAGTTVTFTATPTNGGTPVYQWKVNGTNVGTNSASYSNSQLVNGAVVTCVMTSSLSCITGSPASDSITMVVNPVAGVTISSNEGNTICAAVGVTFTARAKNGGTNPSFQWKLNGANVGANDSIFSSSTLNTNDKVYCVLTSNAACVTGNPAASDTITIFVNSSGPELVKNGDFSLGNVDFSTSYLYSTTAGCGNYGVSKDANSANSAYWMNCGDHTTGTGNYMWVDGSCSASIPVWSQTISSITPNTNYLLSAWVNSLYIPNPPINAPPATLVFTINGQSVGQPITTPVAGCNWIQFYSMWNSGNSTSADITISNEFFFYIGDDFGLDDISFKECCAPGLIKPLSDTICMGDSIQLSAPVGTNYTWSPSTGLSKTNIADPKASPSVTTTYTVTFQQSCGTASPIFVVNVNPTQPQSVSISANNTSVCNSNTVVNFQAFSVNAGSHPNYQWQINGVNVGSNSSIFSTSGLTNNPKIRCIMTSNLACVSPNPDTSNVLSINLSSTVNATVSISANPGNIFCQGTLVTFTAIATNGGINPSYQWKINGVNVGTNRPIFTINTLANSDVITCVMTSNDPCVSVNPVTSNSITITLSSNSVTPSVDITAVPGNTICQGTPVNFTTVPVNGGAGPTYQWQLNGAVITGQTNSTYSSSSLNNGDIIEVVMTSNSACATDTPVTSNAVSMKVDAEPVAGAITGIRILCANSLAHLADNSSGGGSLQWQFSVDSLSGYSNIAGATSATYSSGPLGRSVFYRVIVTNGICSDTSVSFGIVVLPAPTAAFTSSVNGYLVDFDGSGSTGATSYTWSFGDNTSGNGVAPTHTYDSVGTYHICLTVENSSKCNATLCKNISIYPTGINSVSNDATWQVYPDPFSNQLYIHAGDAALHAVSIEMYDVLGRKVFYKETDNKTGNPITLEIDDLNRGVYFIKIATKQDDYIKTVIRQ